jgi:hypothetical protein
LYSSRQAPCAVSVNLHDWVILGYTGLYFAGNNLFMMPMLISFLFVPRRWVQMKYFTWYAELLPE